MISLTLVAAYDTSALRVAKICGSTMRDVSCMPHAQVPLLDPSGIKGKAPGVDGELYYSSRKNHDVV